MLDKFSLSGLITAEEIEPSAEVWTPYTGEENGEDGGPPLGHQPRRREPRYLALENRLWLQWWEAEEYLGRSARLVNVSRSGAMIVSWVLLRERQRVRVYLEEPAPQIAVEATVLGSIEGITGMHQIRLGFSTPCPDAFIEAAANGFESWLEGKRSRI